MTALQGYSVSPLGDTDLADVHALYSDPRVWTHLPSGRHTDEARSQVVIDRANSSRVRTGLGAWAVREDATSRFVGTAGVNLTALDVWNLGYRLHPDYHGRGLATELARQAITAARSTLADSPVVARVLDSNPASFRVLERVGFTLQWRGAVPAADGGTLARRVYADRPLPPDLLDRLIALG